MTNSGEGGYHHNWYEKDENLRAEVRKKYVELSADPTKQPWPEREQKRLVEEYEKHVVGNELTYEGEHGRHLGRVFPNTRQGIDVNLRNYISWGIDNPALIRRIIDRPREGIKEPLRHVRAPGGAIVPLLPEDCEGENWETCVADWLVKNDAKDKQSILALGKKIAESYGYGKDIDKIFRQWGKNFQQYTPTYHFHALSDGEPNDHTHCCGAHANDTRRAMMSAIAQAALIAWATGGERGVTVQGRRTATDSDQAEIFDPFDPTGKQGFDDFLKKHFSTGYIPDEKTAQRMLMAGGKLYRGTHNPTLRQIFDGITNLNKAFRNEGDPETMAVGSCADDRLRLMRRPDGRLIVSQVKDHTSDIIYLTIGRRAFNIREEGVEPPGVYRSTPSADVANVGLGDIDVIRSQLLYDVPLIVNEVMAHDLPQKQVFIDVVVGAESEDWYDPKTDTVKDPDTERLLNNPKVRQAANKRLQGRDRILPIKSRKEDKKNGRDAAELGLTVLQTQACIRAHELLVFSELDKVLENELRFRLKEEGFGTDTGNGPAKSTLRLRIVRVSKGKEGTMETRDLGIHEGP